MSFSNLTAVPKSEQTNWLRIFASTVLTLIVLTTIVGVAWNLLHNTGIQIPALSPALVIAIGLAVVYRIVNTYGWALVLRGLGHHVSAKAAAKVWLVAESRRWLPGGVWGYTSRAVSAQSLGVSKAAASVSMLAELLITVLAAAAVCLVGFVLHREALLSYASELVEKSGLTSHIGIVSAICIATLIAMSFLMRQVLTRKISRVLEKLNAICNVKPRLGWLSVSVVYFIAMAALNGLVNQALLQTIGIESVPVTAMIAATAAAWLVGLFAFFSPGGILVREVALATLLLPWLSYDAGFMLAVLSRFAQLGAEIVGMLLALAISRGNGNANFEQA